MREIKSKKEVYKTISKRMGRLEEKIKLTEIKNKVNEIKSPIAGSN